MSCIEKIKHDVPHCTSEKGLQIFYDDGKQKYTGYCFSCASRGLEAYVADPYKDGKPAPTVSKKTPDEIQAEIQEIRACDYPDFTHRGIPQEYFKRAQVRMAFSEFDGKTPNSFNFPYTKDGKLVKYKTIVLNKKIMWSTGDAKDVDLFNWEIAKKKGTKRLYVTEGEYDCLALEYMLEANEKDPKYKNFAVVSLPNGVGSAVSTLGRMRKEIELLFDEVVLVADNDEAGRKCIKDVQKIMPDILEAPYPSAHKDSNEILLNGNPKVFAEFVKWKSRKPTIEGVVQVATVLSRAARPPEMGLSYPWQSLTDLVYGQRFGEAVGWGAGVGLGKTLTAHEVAAHNIMMHKERVFMALLEEQNHETLWNVSGKIDSTPYHKPEVAKLNWERYMETSRSLDGQLFLWESESNIANRFDIEEIVKAIRFNSLEYGVRFHVIDNMTRLVDHLPATEQNEFINKWSSEIANLATELDVHIDVYSHLNPPKGKDAVDHESGGEVRATQFTGSRGIMRSFPLLMCFERNKHAEGSLANNSFIGAIKNRKYGGEGKIKTQYQPKTGRLLEFNWEGDKLY